MISEGTCNNDHDDDCNVRGINNNNNNNMVRSIIAPTFAVAIVKIIENMNYYVEITIF